MNFPALASVVEGGFGHLVAMSSRFHGLLVKKCLVPSVQRALTSLMIIQGE